MKTEQAKQEKWKQGSDLTGRRFRKLVALYQTDKVVPGRGMVWHSKCDCGNECDVPRAFLITGARKTCGNCSSQEMIGRKYGKLTVISEAEGRLRGCKLWNCRCDCGNTIVVDTKSLNDGIRRSCGCMHLDLKKDLPGKRYGKLVVLSVEERRNGNVFVHCQCDCGNTTVTTYSNLLAGRTQSCGCIQKQINKDVWFKEGTHVGLIASAKPPITNKSGYKGVYFSKKNRKWTAQIGFQGKMYYLGQFDHKRDAIHARKNAEKK